MALEADEDLPPLIKRSDLLLVDRRAEKKLPRRDGLYVLSVARGLAIRQIHARLDQQFLVSGPGVSEQVSALDVGKLILVFRSIPDDDIKLRGLLERFGLVERFTPYVAGGRGTVRGEEARKWLEDRRNEAIAEITLVVSALAMAAAIVAAVRR